MTEIRNCRDYGRRGLEYTTLTVHLGSDFSEKNHIVESGSTCHWRL